jgi:hypothetical protein
MRGCIPLVRPGLEQCLRQRVRARLTSTGGAWTGAFDWNTYYNEYEYLPDTTNRVTGFTRDAMRLSVTIRR